MIIIWTSVRAPIEVFTEGTHVFVLHGGKFLEFVLAMMNMNLEYVVGLLLNLFLPLVPTQK